MDTSKIYLAEYYKALLRDCKKDAFRITKKLNTKDIHNFRVTIKKMNAFKAFIKFVEPEFEVREKELEKIYKSAGKLRTNKLIKKELKSLKLYDAHWKKYFRNYFKIEKENYCKVYDEFERISIKKFREQEDKIFFVLNEDYKLEESGKIYLKSLITGINEHPNDSTNISLHDVRKLMKELGYNYVLLSEAYYYLIDELLVSDIEHFNKVLGKWHDKIMLRKFILKQKDYQGSDRLAEQVQMDIKKDEDNIRSSLSAFILKNGGTKFLINM